MADSEPEEQRNEVPAKRIVKRPRNHDSLRAEKSIEEKLKKRALANKESKNRKKIKSKNKNKKGEWEKSSLEEEDSGGPSKPKVTKLTKIQLKNTANQAHHLESLKLTSGSTPAFHSTPLSEKTQAAALSVSSTITPISNGTKSQSQSKAHCKNDVDKDNNGDDIDSDMDDDVAKDDNKLKNKKDKYGDDTDSDTGDDGAKDDNKRNNDKNKYGDDTDSDMDDDGAKDDSKLKNDSNDLHNDNVMENAKNKDTGDKLQDFNNDQLDDMKGGSESDSGSGSDSESSSGESTEDDDPRKPPKLTMEENLQQLLHKKDDEGVVELLPGTKIFVDEDSLELLTSKRFTHSSLARGMLELVFTTKALVSCSLQGQTQRGPVGKTERSRPGLYKHAVETLEKKVRSICRDQKVPRLNPSYVHKQMNTKLSELRANVKREEEYRRHLKAKKDKKRKKAKSKMTS
ncbi:Halomucin [Frankliniella fusca]|uniref:Halomucin n=1 Tax=Frankliniella fusca TaxID=407009 RepID=A0AAE1GVX6_9NEOP|nr:Halomucin [Frankliniella fusca]